VIKEAADPEANIIFGTVIDDRMRDEVKVTVIATGFDATKKPRSAGRGAASTDVAVGIETSLDERSREILAEIERDRAQRQALDEQIPEPSPFATTTEREEMAAERQAVPTPAGRPAYGETDLDIPSFLRRKSE
jgi:cell division protein FtsZ